MSPDTGTRLSGDEGDLYALYAERLRRIVRRRVNNVPDALIDDACQLAWINLMRAQPDRETVLPWLTVVATREAWKLSTRERRDISLDRVADLDSDTVLGEVLLADERQRADRRLDALAGLDALAELPKRQKEMLALQAAGYTLGEIAAMRGESYRTVDRQIARGKQRLREQRRSLEVPHRG